MKPQQFTLRVKLFAIAIVASFVAFVRSVFADSLSIIDLVPLTFSGLLMTFHFLVRAANGNHTSAFRLISIGAAAAFFTTSAFGIGAAIVWIDYVYANDSRGFWISPWVVASLFIAKAGILAGSE